MRIRHPRTYCAMSNRYLLALATLGRLFGLQLFRLEDQQVPFWNSLCPSVAVVVVVEHIHLLVVTCFYNYFGSECCECLHYEKGADLVIVIQDDLSEGRSMSSAPYGANKLHWGQSELYSLVRYIDPTIIFAFLLSLLHIVFFSANRTL